MGECDASNANQRLRCVTGTFKAEACKGCALQGSNVVCQQ
jgi:hypothetical protein